MKVAVIGAGFSGISAAAYLAKAGNEVHVFEKNGSIGGRARQFVTEDGFVFDMGPSWYWMSDIFENFFKDFGSQSSDYYELVPLNPQFEMVFRDESLCIPQKYEDIRDLFERLEPHSAKKLDRFMEQAKKKYETGMLDFAQKPSLSWLEFASPKIAKNIGKLNLFTNFHKYTRKYFSNEKLIALMEFPVLFLGAMPKEIPAMYSMMNYGGIKMGTHYPLGGFGKVIDGMAEIAKNKGVVFHLNSTVEKINIEGKKAKSISVNGKELRFDAVVASSDYQHTEQELLEKPHRNYSQTYWEKKTFAPSCLIFYLGIRGKIPNLQHHSLFFENDLEVHANEIYKDKKWPSKPLFYVCCPSKTDKGTAPENHENLFLLMPIATGLKDSEEMREHYFLEMMSRIESHTKTYGLAEKTSYKKSYCLQDFKTDYNAYGGNAYGLANTLKQTAVLKPAIKNKKTNNLYYTGQLTVPGPGVPPCIISGKIAASLIGGPKK